MCDMLTSGSGSGSGADLAPGSLFGVALGGGGGADSSALPLPSVVLSGTAQGGGLASSEADGVPFMGGEAPLVWLAGGAVVKLLGVGGPVESAVEGSGGSMSMRFGSSASAVVIVCV